MPPVVTPLAPDPATADGLAPCRAGQLASSATVGAALGTTVVTVRLDAKVGVRCSLSGTPTIAIRATGPDAPVATVAHDITEAYGHAVALDPANPATFTLAWPSVWCAGRVTIAAEGIALTLPGGSLRLRGVAPPVSASAASCRQQYGTPPPGQAAIMVGSVDPWTWTPAQARSPLADVEVGVDVVGTATAVTRGQGLNGTVLNGTVLRGRVTLTSDHDVALSPCPDLLLVLDGEGFADPAGHLQRHGLDCAAVAARDPLGQAVLRAGVPVRLAVEWLLPATASGPMKAGVSLDPPDGPGWSALVPAAT